MYFEIVDKITEIRKIAVGKSIRDLRRLTRQYGKGRWRKLNGVAYVRFKSGIIRLAELRPATTGFGVAVNSIISGSNPSSVESHPLSSAEIKKTGDLLQDSAFSQRDSFIGLQLVVHRKHAAHGTDGAADFLLLHFGIDIT